VAGAGVEQARAQVFGGHALHERGGNDDVVILKMFREERFLNCNPVQFLSVRL
jgi:hypothetical protein